jgi:hypothetical protein
VTSSGYGDFDQADDEVDDYYDEPEESRSRLGRGILAVATTLAALAWS